MIGLFDGLQKLRRDFKLLWITEMAMAHSVEAADGMDQRNRWRQSIQVFARLGQNMIAPDLKVLHLFQFFAEPM